MSKSRLKIGHEKCFFDREHEYWRDAKSFVAVWHSSVYEYRLIFISTNVIWITKGSSICTAQSEWKNIRTTVIGMCTISTGFWNLPGFFSENRLGEKREKFQNPVKIVHMPVVQVFLTASKYSGSDLKIDSVVVVVVVVIKLFSNSIAFVRFEEKFYIFVRWKNIFKLVKIDSVIGKIFKMSLKVR